MAITRKKLARFIKARLKSGFASNLQFQIDANECGFEVSDLGPVRKFRSNGTIGYEWQPVVEDGTIEILVEFGAYLFSTRTETTAARHFFAHDYKDVEFIKPEKAA